MKNIKTSFSAVVKLPESIGGEEATIDVELDKDEMHLTFDEVEDAILAKVEDEYGFSIASLDEDDIDDDSKFPTVISIVINKDDGSYPVIAESIDDKALAKSKVFDKYLVLPYAIYGLTPECKLWMQLKESGVIDADAPFDFDKYHSIIKKQA